MVNRLHFPGSNNDAGLGYLRKAGRAGFYCYDRCSKQRKRKQEELVREENKREGESQVEETQWHVCERAAGGLDNLDYGHTSLKILILRNLSFAATARTCAKGQQAMCCFLLGAKKWVNTWEGAEKKSRTQTVLFERTQEGQTELKTEEMQTY